MLEAIFERFVEESPTSVMVRGLMERIFCSEKIDEIFEANAKTQYTRELLFSTLVDLMSLVVCGIYPSVNAAYKRKATKINVSRTAVYDKINRVDPEIVAALLRETADELASLIDIMGGKSPSLLPGYKVRILDGTCLAATDHRLEVLRDTGAGPLPGKALVVLDPSLRLAINVFPCQDGHAQERSLFQEVLETVKPGELWIADRNMCTLGFLFGLNELGANFVIREHKSMPQTAITDLKPLVRVKKGRLFEQTVRIELGIKSLNLRRVVVKLLKPTKSGEKEVAILTALPGNHSGALVSKLYLDRRRVENLFQFVTQNYEGEIKTLGYPKAALFSFCLALVSYNILATIEAAIASVHGVGKVEAALSHFYLVDEIQGTYRGMAIAISAQTWQFFESVSLEELAQILLELAAGVNLSDFLKQPRGPKRKKDPPLIDPRHRHVSTARLLAAKKTP